MPCVAALSCVMACDGEVGDILREDVGDAEETAA